MEISSRSFAPMNLKLFGHLILTFCISLAMLAGTVTVGEASGSTPIAENVESEEGWLFDKGVSLLSQTAEEINPDEVIDITRLLVTNGEWDLVKRLTARITLIGQADLPKALPILKEFATIDKREVETMVAQSLKELGTTYPDSMLPVLVELADTQQGIIRIEVIRLLSDQGNKSPETVLPVIETMASDEKKGIRWLAAEVLHAMTQKHPDLVISTLKTLMFDECVLVWDEASKALGKIGNANPDEVLPFLLEIAEDDDYPDRQRSVTSAFGVLCVHHPEKILPLIKRQLEDELFWHRYSAAEVLAKMITKALGERNHHDLNNLLPLLGKFEFYSFYPFDDILGKPFIRLGAKNPHRVLPILRKMATGEKQNTAEFALRILAEIGYWQPAKIVPVLQEMAINKNLEAAKYAAVSLGVLGKTKPDAVFPVIEEWVESDYQIIRGAALPALGTIGERNPDRVIPFLKKLAKHEDSLIRSNVAGTLGALGKKHPGLTVPLLIELTADDNKWVREEALLRLEFVGWEHPRSVVQFFKNLVIDESIELLVRLKIIEAIGRIGKNHPHQALDVLQEFTTHEHGAVRVSLIKALGEIGMKHPDRAVLLLKDQATDEDPLLKTMAKAELISVARRDWVPPPKFPDLSKATPEPKVTFDHTPDKSRLSPGKILMAIFPNGVTLELGWIPPGEFSMGSPDSECYHKLDETPVHTVHISKGFWMGRYEVTIGQYVQFVKMTGIEFDLLNNDACLTLSDDGGYILSKKAMGKYWEQPMLEVDWFHADFFCRWLSRVTGKRFRLPTEAEWEYACRAGTDSALYSEKVLTHYSTECDNLNDLAWYGGNSRGKSWPVGQKLPNAWGLYDMYGNAWEWCHDWYGKDYYSHSPEFDPRGPSSGTERVLRGGNWRDLAAYCRSADRFSRKPDWSLIIGGVRVVMEADE